MADGGRGPHGAQGAGHSEGGTSRDSEQIASLTARAIQTARATIYCDSCVRMARFYAAAIPRVAPTLRVPLPPLPPALLFRVKTDIDKMARFSAVRWSQDDGRVEW